MTKSNLIRKPCSGCPSNPHCTNKPLDHAEKIPRCKSCSKECGDARRKELAERRRCIGWEENPNCTNVQPTRRKRCRTCATMNKQHEQKTKTTVIIPKEAVYDVEHLCFTPGCTNIRTGVNRRRYKNGNEVVYLRSRCNACIKLFERTGEALERIKLQRRIHYHTYVKTNPELMEKKRQNWRKYHEIVLEGRRQEWEITKATTPHMTFFSPSTTKFAAKIFTEALDALQSYNIRFLAEFNYLHHGLYKRSPGTTEHGIRADLLVEIDLEGREKPLTVVIEAQGPQHRPLLQQHLENVGVQIKNQHGDLADSDRSLLLEVVQNNNIMQLQLDLAKLLMTIKQGFVHIIVYDVRSMKQVIADVLNGTENARVYYPNGNTVDMNSLVRQFVDQLLFREGSWRSCVNPCPYFELAKAFSIMSKDRTIEILDDDADTDEDENLLSHITDNPDRQAIFLYLERIDPKFLNSKCVENLTIDFTKKYACSINAKEKKITSFLPSSDRQLRPRKEDIKTAATAVELSVDRQFRPIEKDVETPAPTKPSEGMQLRPRKKDGKTPAPTEELSEDKQPSVVEKKGKGDGKKKKGL